MIFMVLLVTCMGCIAMEPLAIPDKPKVSIPIIEGNSVLTNNGPINVYYNAAENDNLEASIKNSDVKYSTNILNNYNSTNFSNSAGFVNISGGNSSANDIVINSKYVPLNGTSVNDTTISPVNLGVTTMEIIGTTKKLLSSSPIDDYIWSSIVDDSSMSNNSDQFNVTSISSNFSNNQISENDVNEQQYMSDIFFPAHSLKPYAPGNNETVTSYQQNFSAQGFVNSSSGNEFTNSSYDNNSTIVFGPKSVSLVIDNSNFTDDFILPNKSYDKQTEIPDGNDTIIISGVYSNTNILRVDDPMRISNVYSALNIYSVYSPLNISNIYSLTNISNINSPVHIVGVKSPLSISDVYSPIKISDVYSPITITNVYSPVNISNVHSSINATKVYSLINIDDYSRKTKVSEVHNSINSNTSETFNASISNTPSNILSGTAQDNITEDVFDPANSTGASVFNSTSKFNFTITTGTNFLPTVSYFDYEDLFTTLELINKTNINFTNPSVEKNNSSDFYKSFNSSNPSNFTNISQSFNSSNPANTTSISQSLNSSNPFNFTSTNQSFTSSNPSNFTNINQSFNSSNPSNFTGINISAPPNVTNISTLNTTTISSPNAITNKYPFNVTTISYPYDLINYFYPYNSNISNSNESSATFPLAPTDSFSPYDEFDRSDPDFSNYTYGSNYPNITFNSSTNISDILNPDNTSNGNHGHRCQGGDILRHIFLTYRLSPPEIYVPVVHVVPVPVAFPTLYDTYNPRKSLMDLLLPLYYGMGSSQGQNVPNWGLSPSSNSLPGASSGWNFDLHGSHGDPQDSFTYKNAFANGDLDKTFLPIESSEENSFEPKPYYLIDASIDALQPSSNRHGSRGPLSYLADYGQNYPHQVSNPFMARNSIKETQDMLNLRPLDPLADHSLNGLLSDDAVIVGDANYNTDPLYKWHLKTPIDPPVWHR